MDTKTLKPQKFNLTMYAICCTIQGKPCYYSHQFLKGTPPEFALNELIRQAMYDHTSINGFFNKSLDLVYFRVEHKSSDGRVTIWRNYDCSRVADQNYWIPTNYKLLNV